MNMHAVDPRVAHATHLVVGGGSAGCVMAARLSEAPANRVILLEAGTDYPPDRTPDDIRDNYAGRALMNGDYFWPKLKARRRAGETPQFYEQGRVIGGGSSVNGQTALRGAPEDFDRWHELGAKGWDWNSCLPYFRRMETDADFQDQFHGATGPIAIRRMPVTEWDEFTRSIVAGWDRLGYKMLPDMNGEFGAGYSPLPVSNDGSARSSTATGYLDAATRSRPNLTILDHAQARRILFADGRATGVEITRNGTIEALTADNVIVSAGALHSPWLLMLSGIGPAEHLRQHGIAVVLDRPGVGSHLMDHPSIQISGYLAPTSRDLMALRRTYTYLRWSSGLPGVPEADMVMTAVCRSAWHAVGLRIATLTSNVGHSYSTGTVRLNSADPNDEPDVNFNWLSDRRDMDRMIGAFGVMMGILTHDASSQKLSNLFASKFSPRVRAIGKQNLKNAILTNLAAAIMDNSKTLRKLLFENFITESPPLAELQADPARLEKFLLETTAGAWHGCCTCRMGDPADPNAVVNPGGQVIGTPNLFVADASVMPEICRTNTNLPTIMIAERLAESIRARG